MSTVAELDKRIIDLKKNLDNVKGQQSEVYARIVGYYRSVANWNRGKSEEYTERVNYCGLGKKKIAPPISATVQKPVKEVKVASVQVAPIQATPIEEAIEINFEEPRVEVVSLAKSYSFFYKNTCPNCPPVKAVIDSIEMKGNKIDVDLSDGLTEAMNFSVYSAPTVILFDGQGDEVYRTSNADKLKEFLVSKSA